MNNSIYAIIINVVQTTEKKNNKVIKKVDNLYNDFNIEKQPKDPRNNLRTTKKNIELIPDPNFNIDRLRKPPITFKLSNLKVKISENAFCIVTKNSIYIYLKDFQKVCIFQKIYKRYFKI